MGNIWVEMSEVAARLQSNAAPREFQVQNEANAALCLGVRMMQRTIIFHSLQVPNTNANQSEQLEHEAGTRNRAPSMIN